MICNSCGAEIPGGVNFCTYCGAEQKPIDLKVCKKCNYSNRVDDTNCKKCGSNLAVEGTDFILTKTGIQMDASPAQPVKQQPSAVPPKAAHKPSAPVLPPFGMEQAAAGMNLPKSQMPPSVQHPQSPAAPQVPSPQAPVRPVQPPLSQPNVKAGIPTAPAPLPPQFSQVNHPQISQVPAQQSSGMRSVIPSVPQQSRPIVQPSMQPGFPAAPRADVHPTPVPEMQVQNELPIDSIPVPKIIPTDVSGQFLFCDICGAKNESDLSECKYCKSPLKKTGTSPVPMKPQNIVPQEEPKIQTPVPQQPSEDKAAMPKGKICKKCNTENPVMMLICYNCGEPLDDGKSVQKAQPSRMPNQIPTSQPQMPHYASPAATPPIPMTQGEPLKGVKGEVSKKICPKCGTPNLLGSTVCGHCGFLFKGGGEFSDDTETKPFLVCPKCYFRNAVDATECAKCHTTLKILPNVKVKDHGDYPIIGESTVKCPVCGVDNPREVLSCKNCNYNFLKKKQEVIQVAPPPIPEGDRVSCPRCGSDNDKNEQRCKICGEKLNKQTTVEIPVYSQQKISPTPPMAGQGVISQPPLPGNLGAGAQSNKAPVAVPSNGIGQNIPVPSSQRPKNVSAGASVAPPPPIGAPGGGAVVDPKVQFVPDWKQGKKAGGNAPTNAIQDKEAKPKGTFSKKTAMMIILGVVAVVVIAIVLMVLDKGSTSSNRESESHEPIGKNFTNSGSGKISEEEISDSGSTTSSAGNLNTKPPSSEVTGVQVDNSKTPGTQNDISLVEDKDSAEINDFISKGKEALKRGRVNYPRNNNALYYFQQAKDKGSDSTELEELKTQLNTALHALGDKKLGERSFKDANTFYDLAAQVDPDDTSIRRKKNQVREMQRRTEIEQNELNAAIKTQTIAELEKFVDKYPTSPLAARARDEIVRLKKIKQDTEALEEQRKKDEEALKAYEEKQYVFNVVHSYFMGKNRGKLIINRKGVLFEPVDNKNERFYASYNQIESVVFDDGEIVIKFNQSIGDVGNEIALKHITESEPKTKQIFDAYSELRPK